MPDTPVYEITYPCEGDPISMSDFSVFAADVEAALVVTDAEADLATHLPNARGLGSATPAVNVEATLTYLASPAANASSGITFNAAAGTFTMVTPGIYLATVQMFSPESTLTVTSQRVAVAVNAVNTVVKKQSGAVPPTILGRPTSYSTDIAVAAGDVVTFRYLWTGTGALASAAFATVTLDLLATP
jgi:hypothetical protein